MTHERLSGIYIIRAESGAYIGQSVDIYRRLREHLEDLRLGKHHCQRLQAAYDQLGERAFDFGLLAVAYDRTNRQAEEAGAIHRWARQHGVDKLLNTHPYHVPAPACLFEDDYCALDAFDV